MAKIYYILGLLIVVKLGVGEPLVLGNGDEASLSLDFLGTIEGISYFVEANQSMTWYEARAHCKQATMELASVKTRKQAEELNVLLHEKYGYATFWTSARESARSISGLSWDKDGERLDSNSFIWNQEGPRAHYYCGRISPSAPSSPVPYMKTTWCTFQIKVLCQIE